MDRDVTCLKPSALATWVVAFKGIGEKAPATIQTFNSAPVDRTSASVWLFKYPLMSKNKPSTSMTHVACESKLRSVVRSFIHP